MQAVTIRSFGDPDGLVVSDLPEPSPAPGFMLIETDAIGVGGVDAVIRRGTLGTSGFSEGLVPGSEIAGRVIEVGEGVDRAWLGQRVWAFTGISGGYAERAVAAVDDVTVLPDALSMIDVVTLGSAGPVAHFALAHAHFTPGESVLIRGAAGSIGIMAVQLAAAAGARAIGVTTSSDERGERLRALGAVHVLDRAGSVKHDARSGLDQVESDEVEFDEMALDEMKFDVIVDIVGGAAMPTFFERLSPNGRLVCVGVVGGYPPADFGMSLMRAFQRSLSFATFSLNTVPIPERNRVRADQFEAAAQGRFQAVIHDVLPLSQAAEAHRQMDAGEVFGRIVLTPR